MVILPKIKHIILDGLKTLTLKLFREVIKMQIKKKNGFTLAELLIVVAIIGVLTAVAIPVFSSQLEKSREATDIANLRSAKAAAVSKYLADDLTEGTFYFDAQKGVLVSEDDFTADSITGYGKGTAKNGAVSNSFEISAIANGSISMCWVDTDGSGNENNANYASNSDVSNQIIKITFGDGTGSGGSGEGSGNPGGGSETTVAPQSVAVCLFDIHPDGWTFDIESDFAGTDDDLYIPVPASRLMDPDIYGPQAYQYYASDIMTVLDSMFSGYTWYVFEGLPGYSNFVDSGDTSGAITEFISSGGGQNQIYVAGVKNASVSAGSVTFSKYLVNPGCHENYYDHSDTCFTISADTLTWDDLKDAANGSKYNYTASAITDTSIGLYAFQNCCTGITNITIPSTVTSIGDYAFYYCHELTNLTIPGNVQSIGSQSFCQCVGLQSVTLEDGVQTIGMMSFCSCTAMTTINIPVSVTSIDYGAFYRCSALTDINYAGTQEQWNAITLGEDWNTDTGTYTIHCTDGDISK